MEEQATNRKRLRTSNADPIDCDSAVAVALVDRSSREGEECGEELQVQSEMPLQGWQRQENYTFSLMHKWIPKLILPVILLTLCLGGERIIRCSRSENWNVEVTNLIASLVKCKDISPLPPQHFAAAALSVTRQQFEDSPESRLYTRRRRQQHQSVVQPNMTSKKSDPGPPVAIDVPAKHDNSLTLSSPSHLLTVSATGFTVPRALVDAATNIPTLEPTVSALPTTSTSPTFQPTVSSLPTSSFPPTPSTSDDSAPTSTNEPTHAPPFQPTTMPTLSVSSSPSSDLSNSPSASPTTATTSSPSNNPTMLLSSNPTTFPTQSPTLSPSLQPSLDPTLSFSASPSLDLSNSPSAAPTTAPTSDNPTMIPSLKPTTAPTHSPTSSPSWQPSLDPTLAFSASPSSDLSNLPSAAPTIAPTSFPSDNPSMIPSLKPTITPTHSPTSSPSWQPSLDPTESPSTVAPTAASSTPSFARSLDETSSLPTNLPTFLESFSIPNDFTLQPTFVPTTLPSIQPITILSPTTEQPSKAPSFLPTTTTTPSQFPSSEPSVSFAPTRALSEEPSLSQAPSFVPTIRDISCESDEDCIFGREYCSSGTCLAFGTCSAKVDCRNPSNLYSTVSCIGFLECEEGQCVRVCSNSFCSNNRQPFYCFVAPCEVNICEGAVSCVDDYCGGCNSIHFDRAGSQICIAPTPSPTISQGPSALPSSAPSSGPTRLQSESPSISISPTSTPSRSPSMSLSPTSSPSASPSLSSIPTPSPSAPPSLSESPTRSGSYPPTLSSHPTTSPSTSPSASPTDMPSMSPSVDITGSPTLFPTTSSAPPSNDITVSPTVFTALSSMPPSNDITGFSNVSSTSPTLLSSTPSRLPSSTPSRVPSPSPSFLPSTIPSISLAPTKTHNEFELRGVTMNLAGVANLEEENEQQWAGITADHIAREVVDAREDVRAIEVEVIISNKFPLNNRLLVSGRDLQGDNVRTLAIIFDVKMLLLSDRQDHDIRGYVRGAFSTNGKRQDYVSRLVSTFDSAFASLTSVQVLVPQPNTATESPVELQKETDSNTPFSTGLIIGLSVAIGAVTLLLFIFGYQWYRREGETSTADQADNASPLSGDYEVHLSAMGPNVDIMPRSDISTLGDPIPASGIVDQSTISGDTLNYDYRRSSRDHQSVISESSGGSHVLMQTDDATLDAHYVTEEKFVRYEILAPPGVLGLVLEADDEGVPVVHTIKESSPLRDQIIIGDKLVMVDGVDATVMLAYEVTRLIASKADKERRLVFARSTRSSLP